MIELIGQANYNVSRSPCQNFVRYLLNKGQLTTKDPVTIEGWDFSFYDESSVYLELPINVISVNCRLISEGAIQFYRGTFTASVNGATVAAIGNAFSIANADAPGSKAIAMTPFAIANANGPDAVASANGRDAISNANAPNSVAVANVGATSNANVADALALANGSHCFGSTCSVANANAPDSTAIAYHAENATANANVVGSRRLTGEIRWIDVRVVINHAREQIRQQMQQEAVDNSNVTFVQAHANRIQRNYNAPGGIHVNFALQKPSEAQVIEIYSFVKIETKYFGELTSNTGMKAGTATLFLSQGQDCISLEKFDSTNQKMEWCLLKQGENTYNLVTAETAEQLMSSGNRHPFIQRELMAGDIIRGKDVLAMFNAAKQRA